MVYFASFVKGQGLSSVWAIVFLAGASFCAPPWALAAVASAHSSPGMLETVPPRLLSITVPDANMLTVVFSEPMRSHGVEMVSNYVVTGAGAGTLFPNPDVVSGAGPFSLTWAFGAMQEGEQITLTVSGLQDAAGNPIDPLGASASCPVLLESPSEGEPGDCIHYHPADMAGQGRLEIAELTAYAMAWRSGTLWPLPPNPIPVGYVTQAGYIWKAGEYYADDCGDEPGRWSPAFAAKTRADENFAGKASRRFEGDVVVIDVYPASNTRVFALEERMPPAVLPMVIDGDGVFDARNRRLCFGPCFSNLPARFSYRLLGRARGALLHGKVSFDGMTSEITGETSTQVIRTTGDGGGEGEGEGEGAGGHRHSADINGDGTIELHELLRVVQLYHAGRYGCSDESEDGFAPGAEGCAWWHSSDYAAPGPDWRITLNELLRTVQLFNAGGYRACSIGEDGYCAGHANRLAHTAQHGPGRF